jgi:hypothetical protein
MEEKRINVALDGDVHSKLHALCTRAEGGPATLGQIVSQAIEEKYDRDIASQKICCPGFAARGVHEENCKRRSL